MKLSKKNRTILILLLIIAIFGLVFAFRQKKQATQTGVKKPEVTFNLNETPEDFPSFNFQVEENSKTISVSWDESKIKIFYLILADPKAYEEMAGEKSVIFSISSLKEPPKDLSKLTEAPAFLPQPYLIGAEAEGFVSSRGEASLEKGKEYWIQIIGLNGDKKAQFVSKKFIFGQND